MTEYWKMVLEGPGKGLEFFYNQDSGNPNLSEVCHTVFLSLKYICNSVLSC